MDKYFFYNYKEVDKFRAERDSKLMDLYRKYFEAKEKGNVSAAKKTITSILKFKKETEKFKAWADEAGYCWF